MNELLTLFRTQFEYTNETDSLPLVFGIPDHSIDMKHDRNVMESKQVNIWQEPSITRNNGQLTFKADTMWDVRLLCLALTLAKWLFVADLCFEWIKSILIVP